MVVVSGGSRGLGGAIVDRLLHTGHDVAAFSRRPSPQVDSRQADPVTAPRFLYQSMDAADGDAIRQFVQSAAERFGRIDALVNNAALAYDGVLPTLDDAAIDAMLNVNLKGAILLARECVRQMLLHQRGTIVNIASAAALRGAAGLSVYAATKAGLVGLTRSLARELGPRGIRVNALAPGYLETEMSADLTDRERASIVRRTPLGRLGQVGDVVPWVEFLLSEESGFMTGEVLTVDGGASA